MAIALGQPVDEITHGLEGIKIDGHVIASGRTGKPEVQVSSGLPPTDVMSVQALPEEGRRLPGGEVALQVYPSEVSVSSIRASLEVPSNELSHPPSGFTRAHPGVEHITFATEQFPQHSFTAVPNSSIPLQGPTYTGYPAPIVNFQGYMPYSSDGVVYHNPVAEYNPVYNQNFYCPAPCAVAPINFGYAQAYAYPQYEVAPVEQYNVAAPLSNEDGMMIPEVQDAGSFMLYGYQHMIPGHEQFVSMAMVGSPPACNVSGFDEVPYSDACVPGVLNASPLTWVEQPAKLKGSNKEDMYVQLKPVFQQPNIATDLGHFGNTNGYQSSSEGADTKVHMADGRRHAKKQFGPLYDANTPFKGAWNRAGPRQCMNTAQPLKVLSGKSKGPGARLPTVQNFSKLEFNLADFSTEFEDAKHFVIKSFSEENVYRSIQYGVWASTPNGNKKLDEAYQDAQCRAAGKAKGCPVFLHFSVNGSGRFCGVAEMLGPVDFYSTMDFWERNRWCGSFPVKWHFIKDVPHCQLRRIILQNNENNPVTSSRDTQEVNFEQGLQMLNIIKNYSTKASILDNFPNLSAPQKEVANAKVEQPSLKRNDQADNRVVQESSVGTVPETSNALRACNSEAKARENHLQGKPIHGKTETLFQDLTVDSGGRKLDKENVMIPDVSVVVSGRVASTSS